MRLDIGFSGKARVRTAVCAMLDKVKSKVISIPRRKHGFIHMLQYFAAGIYGEALIRSQKVKTKKQVLVVMALREEFAARGRFSRAHTRALDTDR